MNTTKVTFCWVLIIIGLALHTQFELSGLLFGENVQMPDANGKMPYTTHYFNIAVIIVPLFFALITSFVNHKIFRTISLVYAALLLLLNVFHLIATGVHDIANVSQVALLTFIAVTNIFLVLSIFKWRKEQ